MSQLPFVQAIVAGATFDPLEGWNYQYIAKRGIIKLNHQATAVGLVASLTNVSNQFLQEAPVPAGGTAGTIPSDLTVTPFIEKVMPGRLSLRYRNPTGGTITVSGVIDYTPTGGKK